MARWYTNCKQWIPTDQVCVSDESLAQEMGIVCGCMVDTDYCFNVKTCSKLYALFHIAALDAVASVSMYLRRLVGVD